MFLARKRHIRPGAVPGSLESEEATAEKARIKAISYASDELEEKKAESIDECLEFFGKRDVTWIDIIGTQDVALLTKLGEKFDIHPLTLEDVMNGGQRPKLEVFDRYIFITIKFLQKTESDSAINTEQVSIFLGRDFIITIHDSESTFEPVIQRLKEDRGRIRKMKSDFLTYSLIDLMVDRHFPIMELVAERIQEIDDEVQKKASPEIVRKIRDIKRELILIRSSIWPMREVINSLEREEPEIVSQTTKIFLRDVYDHTIQIIDIVESYRDILSEMFNIYLSVKADSTNEIMKILTIFATIFIPLTFVAGIYGMNFDFMPELKWRYSYFILLGIMLLITIVMLEFFRRRGWIGNRHNHDL